MPYFEISKTTGHLQSSIERRNVAPHRFDTGFERIFVADLIGEVHFTFLHIIEIFFVSPLCGILSFSLSREKPFLFVVRASTGIQRHSA